MADLTVRELFEERAKLFGGGEAYMKVHPHFLAILMGDAWFVEHFHVSSDSGVLRRFGYVGKVDDVEIFVSVNP